MRAKRLYRVVVDTGTTTEVRHYQTRRAAVAYAARRLEGYPERPPQTADLFDEGLAAVPAARPVLVEMSDPITWPEQP